MQFTSSHRAPLQGWKLENRPQLIPPSSLTIFLTSSGHLLHHNTQLAGDVCVSKSVTIYCYGLSLCFWNALLYTTSTVIQYVLKYIYTSCQCSKVCETYNAGSMALRTENLKHIDDTAKKKKECIQECVQSNYPGIRSMQNLQYTRI